MFSQLSYDDFVKRRQIPNLDGFRAISILLVILHHSLPLNFTWILTNIQESGFLGVSIFFQISGFLIATLALREVKLTREFDLKDFYIRRSLRIFPLYYATLAFICFLIFVLNVYPESRKLEFLERLPSYIFYYSNFNYYPTAPFGILWSLAVEEQFYLFFSIFFFFLGQRVAGFIFMLLLIFNLLPIHFFGDFQLLLFIQTALRMQIPILFGVLLAYLLNNEKSYGVVAPLFSNPIFLPLFGLILFLFFAFGFNLYHDLLFNVIVMLVLGGSVLASPMPLVGGAIMSYIGKISYGMYLFHMIILYPLRMIFEGYPWLTLGLTVIFTLLGASLSYEYFEKPILQFKKKFKKD